MNGFQINPLLGALLRARSGGPMLQLPPGFDPRPYDPRTLDGSGGPMLQIPPGFNAPSRYPATFGAKPPHFLPGGPVKQPMRQVGPQGNLGLTSGVQRFQRF